MLRFFPNSAKSPRSDLHSDVCSESHSRIVTYSHSSKVLIVTHLVAKVVTSYIEKATKKKQKLIHQVAYLVLYVRSSKKEFLRNDKVCEIIEVIKNNQYGFRSKRSFADAIASITELVRSAIDDKATAQACLNDLQKVFDTLDHSTVLEKLERYLCRGPIQAMIQSYLSDRCNMFL